MQVSWVCRGRQNLLTCSQLPSWEDEFVAREALKPGSLDWWPEDFLLCQWLDSITQLAAQEELLSYVLELQLLVKK